MVYLPFHPWIKGWLHVVVLFSTQVTGKFAVEVCHLCCRTFLTIIRSQLENWHNHTSFLVLTLSSSPLFKIFSAPHLPHLHKLCAALYSNRGSSIEYTLYESVHIHYPLGRTDRRQWLILWSFCFSLHRRPWRHWVDLKHLKCLAHRRMHSYLKSKSSEFLLFRSTWDFCSGSLTISLPKRPESTFKYISKFHFVKFWKTNGIMWKYGGRGVIWMVTP